MEPNEQREPVVGWHRNDDEGAEPEQGARGGRGLFGGFLVFELICWAGIVAAILVAAAA